MAALKAVVSAAAAWLAASDAQTAGGELLDIALPDVDFFMESAQDPLKELGEQAEMLKKQVAQQGQEKQAAIIKMKASFEQNLTSQAEACDRITEESAKLTAAVAREQDAIASLRREAKKVQKSNDVMRTALDDLRPKLRVAEKFLTDSLAATDDSTATELNVLRATTPVPTLERFLSDMGETGRKVSLLGKAVTLASARKTPSPATPEDIVGTLAQRLDDLAAAGDRGEAQLKARFLADHELGETRRAELLAQKQALEHLLSEKKDARTHLIAVKKHLLEIRSELEERVDGIRLFAMRGIDTANAALDKAATARTPPSN